MSLGPLAIISIILSFLFDDIVTLDSNVTSVTYLVKPKKWGNAGDGQKKGPGGIPGPKCMEGFERIY